jgi:phosphomethylpyrimidine synthase
MNKITRPGEIRLPEVTTGPIQGSHKVYDQPDGFPDLRVPFREIPLSAESGEPPFRVYDSSGPYTETGIEVDVEKGLPRTRAEWVRERGGVETYVGRDVKPEDNGNVTGKHLARDFPSKPQPMRGLPGQPVTQLEFARAGIVTPEMIYVAHRENLGRKAALRPGESERWPTARASARACRSSSRRSSSATRSRAAAPSSRPTSIIPSSSRWRSAATSWSRSTPISAIRP